MPDSTMYVHLIVMHFTQTLHIYFPNCQKAVAQSTRMLSAEKNISLVQNKRMLGDSTQSAKHLLHVQNKTLVPFWNRRTYKWRLLKNTAGKKRDIFTGAYHTLKRPSLFYVKDETKTVKIFLSFSAYCVYRFNHLFLMWCLEKTGCFWMLLQLVFVKYMFLIILFLVVFF